MIQKSEIEKCIEPGRVRLPSHVRERMDQRDITADELFRSLEEGEITERYPDDEPFPSCLVEGTTRKGRSVSVVCSLSPENTFVLITAYESEVE